MIKFLDKALVGGQWFDRGMLAEFDAKTETQLIAEGDAISYTVEVSGSIEHALTADHASTADSATAATTASYATSAGNATTANSATTATTADSANTANSANTAANAGYATNAGHADTADTASTAGHATTATSATTADSATTANTANTATFATAAESANTATNATNAVNATNADNATQAVNATNADFATSAGTAGNLSIHPYYHFHGYAGEQVAGDPVFYDRAGINHGVRGANLSDAQMFATPGYVSTVDPATGVTDSVIRIPAVNFDYNGGERLIVWWQGKVTAEASGTYMLGDGSNTGAHGWAVLVNSNQKFQLVLSGVTQGYSGQSNALPFDGQLHSFGFVLDGQAKKYAFWIDETIDPLFSSGYIAFNSGNTVDTKTTATVNLGTAVPSPGSASNSVATATRALVILRLPAAAALPSIANLATVFKQLRASPGKLILASAL